MVKAIEDKDGTVRDAALSCVGILKGRLGESVLDKYLKGVNPQKMAKIDESAKEIKPSKYDRAENWKPPAPKAAKKIDVEMEKPKKVPPKNIGVKPAPKKKAEDEEMLDEAPIAKKIIKAPPVMSSAKPKAALPASTKGPSVPVI
mgnify:CR=1 FL=1